MEFEFVSDNVALDFAGTRMYRESAPLERLSAPGDLAQWIAASALLDVVPKIDAASFDSALQLREAIYQCGVACARGAELPEADRRVVNQFAAVPPVKTRLLEVAHRVREGDLDNVLATVARSAIEAVGGEEHARLRECGGTDCTRLFVDRSRGGNRRWCGMDICGTRAKSAAYRQRHKGSLAP
ncbi:CGNR zinc finger domain-containing protein [Nocardia noduli]|uniref:CGNR zinc finger domain-containing protein n=1 Tax=Nocardia noduli TaxID=2815722 RepID=UPI001C228EA7|nr:ABATE domain-containing protein [Nocardia noduli]